MKIIELSLKKLHQKISQKIGFQHQHQIQTMTDMFHPNLEKDRMRKGTKNSNRKKTNATGAEKQIIGPKIAKRKTKNANLTQTQPDLLGPAKDAVKMDIGLENALIRHNRSLKVSATSVVRMVTGLVNVQKYKNLLQTPASDAGPPPISPVTVSKKAWPNHRATGKISKMEAKRSQKLRLRKSINVLNVKKWGILLLNVR